MSVCRGCGGTGIGAHVSPREAQLLTQKIYLMRFANGARPDQYQPGCVVADAETISSQNVSMSKRYCRVEAWHGVGEEPAMRGRLAMSGPLRYVIDDCRKWIEAGWLLDPGSQMPDESLCCQWCAGCGRAAHILTAHEMEKICQH